MTAAPQGNGRASEPKPQMTEHMQQYLSSINQIKYKFFY